MGRRPTGALESDVLAHLWATGRPQTPREVKEALAGELAYTTVLTILTRLWKKGLVERQRRGRAHAYAAVMSEADLVAGRMQTTFDAADDREATLSRFVDNLHERDAEILRRVLDDLDRRQ